MKQYESYKCNICGAEVEVSTYLKLNSKQDKICL